jgi:hypothetical protein
VDPRSDVPKSPSPDKTVYITKSGSKYHVKSCRYISQTSIPIDLDEAKKSGYSACSVCYTIQGGSQNKGLSKSVQCAAMTKAGNRCTRVTTSSNGRCWQHGGS